ncbi:MAG: hypothetical protein AAF799_09545 [Myxococcota bacterium]
MSRLIGGLRRTLGAPGWWLGGWLWMAAVAGLIGWQIQMLTVAALKSFDALDTSRMLFGVVDVLRDHPAVGAGLATSAIASLVLGAITWTLLSPLLIVRLAGPRPWSELGGRALSGLLPVLVQSVWHLLLRALLMAIVVVSVMAAPPIVLWILGPLVWMLCGVAQDATRVAVVEHGAAPWSVRSTVQGLGRVVRRPGLLIPCLLLSLGQVVIMGTILWMALAGLTTGSLWGVRLLSALSVGLGLWRVATVVEDAAQDATAPSE